MHVAALVLSALVALLHLYFLVLEMFLWQKPFGRKTFGQSEENARITATLAKNQGLYNGFLTAGIVWGLALGLPAGRPQLTFFLACVIVAGVFGAATVSKRILFVQAVPALLALLCVWAAS